MKIRDMLTAGGLALATTAFAPAMAQPGPINGMHPDNHPMQGGPMGGDMHHDDPGATDDRGPGMGGGDDMHRGGMRRASWGHHGNCRTVWHHHHRMTRCW